MLRYWPRGGFEFFPGKLGVLDMHVGIRGREARLLRLMMDTLASSGQTIGVGVGQNTAFFVSGRLGENLATSKIFFNATH